MYFDNASTTKIHPEVLDAMMPYLTENYGNASSHHTVGAICKRAIEESREIIASAIGCDSDEIFFTSGATEANNWAIKGLKNRYHIRPMHMITSNIEHHSITEAMKQRWDFNEDIIYTCVPVDWDGVMDQNKIADNFKLNTRFCSIQHVNNETGAIQPIYHIADRCCDNGIIFHTDATQSFGHLPIDVKKYKISLLSAAAHKIHGPKGVGFLYISKDCQKQYVPLLNGGQQERGLRASTENVAGIVGFGKATEIALRKMGNNTLDILSAMIELELEKIEGVKINVPTKLTDKRHLSIRIEGVRAEELMALLDTQNIFVSAGSACNSDSGQPSHVLKALGLSDEEANSTIRISLDEDTTKEEVEFLLGYLKYDIEVLRKRGI